MGPKKKADEPSSKVKNKEAAKVINDKTFGLKNKNKSKVVAKFCHGVTTQAKNLDGTEASRLANAANLKKSAQKDLEDQKMLSGLSKMLARNNLLSSDEEDEIDPETEARELNLYEDQRNQLDMSENWTEQQLMDNISKIEQKRGGKCATEIVCKFFVAAVEGGKYGWKWICPNGHNCIYKHALPPGYVLKRNMVREEKKDMSKLEQELDEQRFNLEKEKCLPVTKERFEEWKRLKKEKKELEVIKQFEAQKAGKANRQMNLLTGRALFAMDPNMFEDDEDAADNDAYEEEKIDEFEEEKVEETEENNQQIEEQKVEQKVEQKENNINQKKEEPVKNWDKFDQYGVETIDKQNEKVEEEKKEENQNNDKQPEDNSQQQAAEEDLLNYLDNQEDKKKKKKNKKKNKKQDENENDVDD